MTSVGVVGIGDMGSGLAKNLISSGFRTFGYDPDPRRMAAFETLGGSACRDAGDVGNKAQSVFVMVMTGAQAREVILGEGGLKATMKGGTILLTATIKRAEAIDIGDGLAGTGITFIDTPVSGGFPGAQGGTLTMMASASAEELAAARPVMEAVSSTIHHVGTVPGMGQTMKACLQSLIGSLFSATFEASVLAAKAGVDGEALLKVFSTSSAGCGGVNTALDNILDGQFDGTGSHINTMHKDLTISLNLAEELGVPLHTASSAMQIFHAGRTKYPDGDNWVCTRVIEEIVGAQLRR